MIPREIRKNKGKILFLALFLIAMIFLGVTIVLNNNGAWQAFRENIIGEIEPNGEI